ncbi:MAG: kynurenine 3-monooxygenase [Rickettsiales bacterium]|nr:kynurenine 3-monooxygenase [Rickettsiales bacterium]
MPKNEISILGAGLVGSLLGSLIKQKGFDVNIYEMRSDLRNQSKDGGKSINLALSHRGIRSLKMAGIYDQIQEELIPMHGRMMHDPNGDVYTQPYGKEGQFINSVSRNGLNKLLINHAEKQGVNFHFEHKCVDVNLDNTSVTFANGNTIDSEVLIGSDGAYSMLRQKMEQSDRFNFQQYYIEHGYKELKMEPRNGSFAMEPNYLHIWPRGNFMLIALPNPDYTFTCTLFFPFEGTLSFASVKEELEIKSFFETYFSDVIDLIPDYVDQFQKNATSSLVTIRTSPWNYKNSLLIGDAGHAIVPFYGQGMNAGFEDCRLLMEWGEELNYNWEKLLPYFSSKRKPDADAIADLALSNFVEMRDHVADDRFLNIKRVEARLQKEYPDVWLPLYSMVTFSDIPYSQALKTGQIQKQVMNKLPEGFQPETVDLKPIIEEFNSLTQDVH